MTRFYTNRSDFEQNHWLDSQKSRVVAMLRDIDSVSSTVQSEGLSHLYHSRGEASLGASKPSSTFSQAVDRVDSMLRSAGKIHKDIVQNIDSKFTKGLDKSFQSLNEVNGSKNPYMSKGKYEKTYTTTNYTSNYGYVTQTHTRQVHYSLSDILDGTNSPIPAAQSLYQDRVKTLREQLRQTDQLTDKQIKELESKSDAELVQEFYPTLESDYSQIKNSTWQEENKEALGLVDNGLKFLAIAAFSAGTLMTGGAALPLALAGGSYLFADGAHSAITGNTLITGTQLSTEDRIWAGAEAVVTLATFGSFAAGQSALRAGKQIPTTVQTIGKLAGYADEGVELGQLASGILSGDGTNATLNYIGGKAFEGIIEGSVKGLQSQLSHIEVSSPSQIQLNARQGQDFVDLQTVEFGKIASKVENNITIKMTVDGVEQKIRVDAIGFDEAGNIRIQEYTTAQNGLKISRQNLLEDLSKYGGTIVGAGKGDFVSGVEIPKGTRIDVVSQKTSNYSLDGNGNKFEVITLENGETAYLSKSTDFNGNPVPVRSLDYLKADGTINWPNEDGFVLRADGSADKTEATLRAGDVIDRYGSPHGAFTSPVIGGDILDYDTRGLPYPESYQAYHQYEITTDITMENIQKAYDSLPDSRKIEFDNDLADKDKQLSDLVSNYIGSIDTVFGAGGGTQIQFGGSVQFYIDLGLIREILP
ncbi:TPA: glycohydrolase toxin TNT-related protein [Streptococcus suis]|uniref:Glycohydrolase toxin TNT-related protein n=3 Tax=Streptococcus suis TaxID=1307 RepID=A0AAW9DG00_STRSU|nr:glycohydrolase toxin TNT-related protein [Streptococcus suis]MDX5037712.1 glycohydrolase toxin TNT-related protein [Streptococcus suis]UUM59724.1 TNT domain-containing protein [Streptococcus suis]WQC91441.1 glycohydrolase toxin TNT-related protein [Streptococcus suis]CYV49462.1 membrane protein [Streptococcus suis]